MSRTYSHLRRGAFGKAEQHFERKFNDYIEKIRLSAHGFLRPVRDFAVTKYGKVETARIKDIAEKIVNTAKLKGEEKQFYFSFIYCAVALMSVKFDYLPYSDPLGYNKISFPDSLIYMKMDFNTLVNEAVIIEEKSEGKTIKKGLERSSFFKDYFEMLYSLLVGKSIDIKSCEGEDIMDLLSDDEIREMHEDFDEAEAARTEEEKEAEMEMLCELQDEEDAFTPMSEKEYDETNSYFAEKLRVSYPGYKDYVLNLEIFNSLIDKYGSEKFNGVINEMVSDFLGAEGLTVFNDEDRYIKMMVSLTRARKALIGEDKKKDRS